MLERSLRTLVLVAVVGGLMADARAQPPQTSAAERDAVIRAVQGLFDGMRTRDTAALRVLLLPELVTVAVRDGDQPVIRKMTVDQFIANIGRGGEQLNERMWNPEVRIDGPVAQLWAPYDFRVGARFSHCGHDSFQLVKTDRGWVITGLIYTTRASPCSGPP
jgi:hypothetical protein